MNLLDILPCFYEKWGFSLIFGNSKAFLLSKIKVRISILSNNFMVSTWSTNLFLTSFDVSFVKYVSKNYAS